MIADNKKCWAAVFLCSCWTLSCRKRTFLEEAPGERRTPSALVSADVQAGDVGCAALRYSLDFTTFRLLSAIQAADNKVVRMPLKWQVNLPDWVKS